MVCVHASELGIILANPLFFFLCSRLLDACHTGLIWGSLWEYFILCYGEREMIGYIPTYGFRLHIIRTERGILIGLLA